MKLQMKREALQKLERLANEKKTPFGTGSGMGEHMPQKHLHSQFRESQFQTSITEDNALLELPVSNTAILIALR